MSLRHLSVIIVGAGFGGLAAAIELRQRGAKVVVFEASENFRKQGDVISVGANGTRIIHKWKGFWEDFLGVSSQFEVAEIYNKTGKLLLTQHTEMEFDGYPAVFTSRGKLHKMMFDYAKSLGADIHLGTKITRYLEDDTGAGVFVADIKISADLVLAADGVRTEARTAVSGQEQKATRSGVAIYRAWFPTDVLKHHPLTEPIANATSSGFKVWIGDGTHCIITTNINLKHVACFVTHTDKADIAESWNLEGDKEGMLECIEGWDETLRQVVRSIPEGNLIDYKILWRDPVRPWVSNNGRIALLGDAAHPHLATAATGGAQAMEDAATIATLLELLGKGQIPLALKAYESLRYQRTSLTQRLGWETRHRWHFTDWEAVAKNPDLLKLPQPTWLQCHDAEAYARENLDAVVSHLKHGTPFASTNVPEDHMHQDWTIDDMVRLEKENVHSGTFYKATQ
ncbi:hypothetical protein BGZ61DRAFT_375494 [Ilyonectria robusta]|uniref:uncharacterized protein n=1 Tax=Ilyonectria robusta TaxID=1079257 RepID=UPI001E8EDED1|nr:uncharacterized protein BGZ61DRAFT_375494 [Ilyonectria robusta]KAH8650768.1 hypothetical protein BGZ61DRAFT_375494 [Ilyonectria robusta]